ncbi:MAG: phosphotransferase, partial [Sphingopyxis sp.]
MIPPPHAPAFLAAHGWGDAQILPLAGDASFRRYFRVVGEGRQAVLMDAPPQQEDSRPFIAIAEYLCEQGLNAPTIIARDLEQGLLLIEDFGDVRLRETIDAAPQDEMAHYAGVTDLLVHLHAQPPMAGLPVHGLDQWIDEVMLFA